MFVPEGLIGILRAAWSYLSGPLLLALLPATALVGILGLMTAYGLGLLIELGYRAGLDAGQGPDLFYLGLHFDATRTLSWTIALVLLVGGFLAIRWAIDRLAERRHGLAHADPSGDAQ
jgi:branched-chain amino acid transport system permease protein